MFVSTLCTVLAAGAVWSKGFTIDGAFVQDVIVGIGRAWCCGTDGFAEAQ